jgi:hypothetical protein
LNGELETVNSREFPMKVEGEGASGMTSIFHLNGFSTRRPRAQA